MTFPLFTPRTAHGYFHRKNAYKPVFHLGSLFLLHGLFRPFPGNFEDRY